MLSPSKGPTRASVEESESDSSEPIVLHLQRMYIAPPSKKARVPSYSIKATIVHKEEAGQADAPSVEAKVNQRDRTKQEQVLFRTIPVRCGLDGAIEMDEWFTLSEGLSKSQTVKLHLCRHDAIIRSAQGVVIGSVKIGSNELENSLKEYQFYADGADSSSTIDTSDQSSSSLVEATSSGEIYPSDFDFSEAETISNCSPDGHEEVEDSYDSETDEFDHMTSKLSSTLIDPLAEQVSVSLSGCSQSDISGLVGKIWLQREDAKSLGLVVKTIFVVRHCESTWNVAVRRRNPSALLTRDHPLSEFGYEQCIDLKRRINEAAERVKSGASVDRGGIISPWDEDGALEARFLNADVFCSPLTRCVQTALLGLEEHTGARRNGMTLLPALREIKGTLGVDCISELLGDEIPNHAVDESLILQWKKEQRAGSDASSQAADDENCATTGPLEADTQSMSPDQCQDLDSNNSTPLPFAVNSKLACTPWSDRVGDSPRSSEIRARLNSLCRTLQYCKSNNIVLVTHSKLILSLFREYLTSASSPQTTDLAQSLKTRKIPNGAIVGFEVLLNDPGPPKIISVRSILGSDDTINVLPSSIPRTPQPKRRRRRIRDKQTAEVKPDVNTITASSCRTM